MFTTYLIELWFQTIARRYMHDMENDQYNDDED